jgi:hypothetical protein
MVGFAGKREWDVFLGRRLQNFKTRLYPEKKRNYKVGSSKDYLVEMFPAYDLKLSVFFSFILQTFVLQTFY